MTFVKRAKCEQQDSLPLSIMRHHKSTPASHAFCHALLSLSLVAAFDSARAQSITSMSRIFNPTTGTVQSETRDGVTTNYTYTATGDLQTVTDAAGVVTHYSNYKLGIAQTEVHAEGLPEQVTLYREVNNLGCITSVTDGEGNKTLFGRDALCRETSLTPANAGAVGATIALLPYSASGPETETLTRGNYTNVKTFDGLGRLVQTVGDGVKITRQYDALGRKKFESYPVDPSVVTPAGTSFQYDALSRLTLLTHADGTFNKYEYQANAAGSPQTKSTDERGDVVLQTMRSFGEPDEAELMVINTPVAATDVTLTRNVRGQVLTAVQGGFTRTYNYDSRFYLISEINPETGTTTYGRNAVGDLISVQVGSAGTTYADVNGLGQIYAVRYPDSSKNVAQSWYRTGKHKSASNGTSTWNWTYDADLNLVNEDLSVGGQDFSTTYTFDGNDRLSSIAYPKKGSVLDLAPDALGRPTKVGSYVTTVAYYPTGQIQSMTYANGVVTAMVPDNRMRPWTVSVGKGGGNAYAGLTTLYDGANNLTSVTDSANASNTRTYGYDGIDRVTRVSAAGTDYPLTYDGSGNITQQTWGGTLNYAYDPTTNRLNSTSGAKAGAYSYDARGNVSSNGLVSFQYDDNSRLRCAKCGSTDQIVYDYDALGMRLSRTKGGQTVYQAYSSSGDLLMEFNAAANQRQEHIYLQGKKVATSTQAAYFATTVTLATSAVAVQPGNAVTLTAAVSGGRTPDGTVNFYDNGNFIGSGTIHGTTVSLTTGALAFGYHNFTASYAGDGANAMSNTALATRIESGAVTATILSIINSILLSD